MTGTQNIRPINANGSAGLFVLIRATIDCRKCTLLEDGSANGGVGQGIQYAVVDPNDPTGASATVQPIVFDTILPATEPIILGGENSMNAALGSTLGRGPQDAPGAGVAPSLGTPLIWVRSATATPIVLRATESI